MSVTMESADMKPLKIAFVIDALRVGGTENQLVSLIRNLDPTRFESFLICLRDSDELEDFEPGCPIKVLDVASLLSYDSARKLRAFRDFLAEEKIDIVQTHFFDSTFFGVPAARMAGIRNIVVSRRDMGFWYDRKLLLCLRMINPMVRSFLTNSVSVKDNVASLERVDPTRIRVIYNGLDPARFNGRGSDEKEYAKEKLGIPRDALVVGIISTLGRRVKRVDLFMKAAARVLESHGNTHFLVIGDGALFSELSNLADELGVGRRLHMAGKHGDPAEVLPAFDIAVNSSDSEGFSNAVLEYMAAGIPAVATAVGGNAELIEHEIDGLLVPPDDPKAMGEAIVKLLNGEQERRAMGDRARRKVTEEFSLEKMISRTEAFYEEMRIESERGGGIAG